MTSLKGCTFKMSHLSGVITIYMVNDRSFWTIGRFGVRHPGLHKEHTSVPVPLTEVFDLISKRWDFYEIDTQTIRELDQEIYQKIPKRKA